MVAHPNGGVKEQVAGLYAQRLAEQGYITTTADAAYQGAGGGCLAAWINLLIALRIFMAWLTTSASIRGLIPPALGLLGICGGGGYSLVAAETDKTV